MKFWQQVCCYFGMGRHFRSNVSGTFLAEAAMIACNIPANINRKEFAFEKWHDWDNELFDTPLVY
jgi:hypothetical protein